MEALINPFKGVGIADSDDIEPGAIVTDPTAACALFARCPSAAETPLRASPALAEVFRIAGLSVKDERGRMGLGSFKALGAAFAIAKRAAAVIDADRARAPETSLSGETFVCASAGNHGLSMAAGARLFGARGVVYLADTVPEAFAERLRAAGAEAVRAGSNYEESMTAAREAADAHGWTLLSDSSWVGYSLPAIDVMEGYLVMTDEVARQIAQENAESPTHVFLQAGVGGLAAASAAGVRHFWGPDPVIVVVEPAFAPALFASINAGKPVFAAGPVSAMGRLDCKEPSHLALRYLAKEADAFLTVTEDEVAETVALLAEHGLETTPSGGAGIAGLQHIGEYAKLIGLGPTSRVLTYLSEGPERVA